MIDKLMENAELLLAQAVEQGADEAEVIARHSASSRVVYEKNDFKISAAGTGASFRLKVHRDAKKGSASTNEESAAALAGVASRALTLASFSIEDEHLVLPEPQEPVELPGRFDPALAELTPAAQHELAASFVAAAKEEPRLSLDGGQLEVDTSHEVIANSHGLRVSDRTTQMEWSLMGMGKTDEEVTSFDFVSGTSWSWDDALARTESTARELVQKLMSNFGARKGESYKGAVLLSPAALGQLLLYPLRYQIGGEQIMDGKSHWEDSLGEKVASELITIRDNPFNLALYGATPYDAEGVATKEWPLVTRGVLDTHIDSTYTAKRRGTTSTGHAGSNLHGVELAPGEKSLSELLAEPAKVVAVERFSGNLDPVTGDFSGVAKGSHYYVGGEHRHPLTETMIAGNFFDMLKNVIAVSDQAEPYCNAYLAPWMLVDGISVTAG